MSNIKIFTSYHKKCELLKNKYIYPIQVGTNVNGIIYEDTLHDNTGDNISGKNGMYCELTAQYWAWKNTDADYYGFMHYRRYFSFNPSQLEEDTFGNVIYERLDAQAVEDLRLNEKTIESFVNNYDVICTEGQNIAGLGQGKTVWEHYKNSPHHRLDDMQKILDIISEQYPDYLDAAQEYMKSRTAYFCNMYILRKDIFNEYSEWLFGILKEHEKRSDFSDYDVDEYRVSGFLAERLWGIYYTWLKKNHGELRFKEVQRSFFTETDEQAEITPVFTGKTVPIVLAADNKYVPYVTVTIQSIIENSNTDYKYDIIILDSNISTENQKKVSKEFSSGRISIRFYNVKSYLENRNLFVHRHFTVEIYYRLLMQDIMKGYDKVVYLDSDLVVLDDVAKLYETDIGENYIAAVVDADFAGCYKGVDPDRKEYYEKVLRMANPYHYFNSGVLVMNLTQFRKNITVKDIFDLAESKKWLFPDQDVLNVICEGHVYYLDAAWNVMMNWKDANSSRLATLRLAPHQMYQDYLDSRKHIKIAHFAGFQKPWNVPDCDFAEYFWKYARNTSVYEQLLAGCGGKKKLAGSVVEADSAYQLQIPGMEETIYIDGMYIRLINKLNKWFPKGSRRRERVKKLAKIFVGK